MAASFPAVFLQPPDLESTSYAYDPLGRLARTFLPDSTRTDVFLDDPWVTVSVNGCFNSSSCEGAKTVEMFDAHGRVVEKQIFEETGSGITQAAATRFTDDWRGNVLTSKQWDGTRYNSTTRISTTYDSVGHKVRVDDPDSGVWTFGCDVGGSLRFRDDPRTNQHLQFCYDALDRVILDRVITGVDYSTAALSCPDRGEDDTAYFYDEAVPFGTGRLTHVEDPSGNTWFLRYDARGRLRHQRKEIRVGGGLEAAEFRWDFEPISGRLDQITYPDNEVVSYGYDQAGMLTRVEGGSTVLLQDVKYDRFGRSTRAVHGNGPNGVGVIDSRDYYDHTRLFRLRTMQSTLPSGGVAPTCAIGGRFFDATMDYTAAGQIKQVVDANSGCASLDTSASYVYDGLGRLREVSGSPTINGGYDFDELGNVTSLPGKTLEYSGTKPHTIARVNGLAVSHDRNGNRDLKPGQSTQTYNYDPKDQLVAISPGSVQMAYDYGGIQVLKTAAAVSTRYFSDLAEYRVQGSNRILTKFYFAGGQRLAMREVATWTPTVTLASVSGNRLFTVVAHLVGQDLGAAAGQALALLLGTSLMGLLIIPTRGDRRALGIVVRQGHALALVVVTVATSIPTTALADGTGCTTCPTPTPQPLQLRFLHYHPDHLGSPQGLTDGSGALVQRIRYEPYGKVRGRWSANGVAGSAALQNYSFTGYEADLVSGLQYARARFYDPDLGMFLTHDPARQFANPYSYGGGDPMNTTDPTGTVAGFDDALIAAVIIGFAAGALAGGIQAAVSGASTGQAFEAALLGGSIGAFSGMAGVIVQPAAASAIATVIAPVVGDAAGSIATGLLFSASVGQAAYGIGQGDYTGLIGLGASIGLGIAYGYAAGGVANGGDGTLSGRLTQHEQLEFFASAFDQRIETPFDRGGWSSVSYVGRILANDLAAAAVGIVAKPLVLGQDLWAMGTSLGTLDLELIGEKAFAMVYNAVVPTYGFYGGAGWGTRQFGNLGVPVPLNRIDWASYYHDLNYKHGQWVTSAFSSSSIGLPPGPVGIAYSAFAAGPFTVAGAFQ